MKIFVVLQNHLRKVNPFAFGNVSCKVCGNVENEGLVVYEFPKPFDMPLAKYGAIYLNKSKKEYTYWPLELSMNGKFYLGSKTTEGHTNYGSREDLSKEEFIHELCRGMCIEETVLQPRNMLSRKYMLELNDRNIEDAIAYSPLSVVCFYDFNQPSQIMIKVLDQMAQEYQGKIVVGIYDVYAGIDNLSASEDYHVMGLPTFLFLKNGTEVKRQIGICKKEDLRLGFEELLVE